MKRVILLVLIAIATFLLFALYKNPGVLEDIWIWVIGLLGAIIKGGRSILEYIKSLFKKEDSATVNPQEKPQQETNSADDAHLVITLLRYIDDGETTIGLLYINDSFYCYTLEDTFRDVKVAGETRIPAGEYTVNFRVEETELTKKYRERYPEWFSHHIQIQNVKDFSSIYIHSGGDHTHTEGCILVSDSLSIGSTSSFLTNSRNTFRRLYQCLREPLDNKKKVVIRIKDEAWFKNLAS